MLTLLLILIVFGVSFLIVERVIESRKSVPFGLPPKRLSDTVQHYALEEAARILQLDFEKSGYGLAIKGFLDGADISVHPLKEERFDLEIRITHPTLSTEVLLEEESLLSGDPKHVPTKDLAFDKRFVVLGPACQVLAMLTDSIRSRLMWLQGRISLREGTLTHRCCALKKGGQRIANMVEEQIALLQAMTIDEDQIAPRLIENATDGNHPAVRLLNFEILCHHFAETEAPATTANELTNDHDPRVRLAAAKFAGLWKTACAVAEDDLVPNDVRQEAIHHLLETGPADRVEPIMAALLDDEEPEVVLAAIRWLGKQRIRAVVPKLLELLDKPERVDQGELILTLGAIADPSAEEPLLLLLPREPPGMLIHCAQALETCGGKETIETTKTLMPAISDERAKQALSRTIAIVSERLGLGPGQLSIATQDGGSLSLPDDREGAISLPDADP